MPEGAAADTAGIAARLYRSLREWKKIHYTSQPDSFEMSSATLKALALESGLTVDDDGADPEALRYEDGSLVIDTTDRFRCSDHAQRVAGLR